ncbi:MAG: O-antigen ligase family protein, partial [Bacteroidota bacterium]
SDYWMERLRLKLPFLLLPFAFYQLHNIIQKHNIGHRYGQSHHSFYDGVLYVLLLLMTVSCIGIGVHYWLNFEEINLAIQQGRAIPTPRNHIRFSLLLAISIISGGYLYAKKYIYRFDWERTLIACCTTFLFIFIHILSVRSGLLALYMALFALLVRFILIKKRYWIGLAGIVALTALPVASYYIVPSFQKKINYAVWDLRTYYAGKGANNSDSGRLVSLQVGWELAQRNMLVGVGAGNLRREVKNIYRQQFPAVTEPKMPHNQWVSVLAGTGILGIIIFGIAFFVPFFYNAHYRQPLFLGYYIIVFTSLLMENTLENSMGIGLYCFFTLLFLNLQYENSLLRETK